MEKTWDVAVIGGGLSGLSAAAYLGRAGLSAVVIEKAKELGGRARTTVEQGYSLNLGPHAVYRMGPAWAVLSELGVPLSGGIPGASGALALTSTGAHALPTGMLSMLTTGLLGLAGKVEVSRVMATIGGVDTSKIHRMTAKAWIEGAVKTKEARDFLSGFVRLSTYTGDMESLSAGAAIAQVQVAVKHNVLYVDGGWQSLVEAVRSRAVSAGATILTGDGVARVGSEEAALERAETPRGLAKGAGRHDEGLRIANNSYSLQVRLQDGRTLRAKAVILATGPHAAAAVAPSVEELTKIAGATRAVKVAVLDVALAKLPKKGRTFGLGTDRATYVSVHSAVARLAPESGAVVHAMTYSPSGDARADERELEEAMECVQPGWREHVVHRRFLPAMVASNDIVAAAKGGLTGRPDVAVASASGLFLAGDWVGPTGMLLDAALASAKRAAEACAAHVAELPRAPVDSKARGARREDVHVFRASM